MISLLQIIIFGGLPSSASGGTTPTSTPTFFIYGF
jgi:hypothetical protein